MSENEVQKVSITNLIRGGLVEMVDDELQRLADNILDPNTSETASRSVTVTIKVKPSKDRSIADTTVSVAAKLAPVNPQATRLFISQRRGKGLLIEHNPEQVQLPLDKAAPLKGVAG
jgi:hypothetical protein